MSGNLTPHRKIWDPLISQKVLELEFEILHTYRQGQVHFSDMKFFPLGGMRGAQRPSVNLGLHISETSRARKLKFYIRLNRAKCTFRK